MSVISPYSKVSCRHQIPWLQNGGLAVWRMFTVNQLLKPGFMLHTCNSSTPEKKQEGPHKFEASLGYNGRLHLNMLICKDQGT